MKYTSGNTTIDAIQFNGEYTDEIYDFAKNDITGHNKQGNFLLIETKRSFVTCHVKRLACALSRRHADASQGKHLCGDL